jgi:hypothetical protein
MIRVNNSYEKVTLFKSQIFVDSLKLFGTDYEILHYHIASEQIEKRMRSDSLYDAFNDSLNQNSRLIFTDYSLNKNFNLATIPLTHIIYLQKLGMIVGLSKFISSPYQIVIYSVDGKLLVRRSLKDLIFKFDKKELKELCNRYPCLFSALTNNVVVKKGDSYYVQPTKCLTKNMGKDSVLSINKVVENEDFPLMGYGTDGGIFQEYYGFFSESSPFSDLIMVGSVPYLLILNSEDFKKVNIPLLSNCDIIKELR